MKLAESVIVNGISFGLLVGLLAFILVLLNKATGVANFAIGKIGMIETYVVYEIYKSGVEIYAAVAIGLVFSALFGPLIYQLVLRPFGSAGQANILVRTVALFLLLGGIADYLMGSGQPFFFPSLLPRGGTSLGGVLVSWSNLIILGIVTAIGTLFVVMFRYTELGLQLLAVAQRPQVARLLGLRVKRLSTIAYMFAGMLALVIGLLLAPTLLLSSQMLDPILLYAFAAAVVGGFTSLPGAFVGGITIGITTNVVATYMDGSLTMASALAIMLLTLLVRPHGIFGDAQVVRL